MNVLYLLDCDINGYRYASEFREVPTEIYSFMSSKTNEWTKDIMTVIKINSLLYRGGHSKEWKYAKDPARTGLRFKIPTHIP